MKKETFEWMHGWCDHTDQIDLPRVLLVGDSITYGYQERVRELLKGVCYVDYVATSYAVDSKFYQALLKNFVGDSEYAAIHFNQGLHGKHLSKRSYAAYLKKLLEKIWGEKKLILATSTLVYEAGNKKKDQGWMKRVKERNAVAWEFAKTFGYAIDDLYSVSEQIPKGYRSDDGTHYKKEGYELLASAVAESVRAAIGAGK